MNSPFFSFLRRSFYIKMIVVMFAISVIPLIVLSFISVSVSSTTVEQQVNRLNAQLVNQVVDRIELTMTRLRELSEQYSRISSIQGALVSPSAQYFEEVVRKKDLISVLSSASAIIGNVEGLQVYSAVTGEVLSSTEAPATLEASPYRPLIEAYLASGRPNLFLDKHSLPELAILNSSTYYISRVPFDLYKDLKGVLLISMSNSQYQQQIENIQLGSKGSISLLTEDGLSIATTSKLEKQEDTQRVQEILKRWKELNRPDQFAAGSSIVSVKQTSTYDKWIVLSEIPSKELTASAEIIRRTVTYFLVLLALLGALCVVGFGYQLYRPLQAVKRQVDALKKGHFDARVTHFANNEIGDLGRMLNTMAVRIQDLLADLHDSEDLKRKLEIRALQSQINPHFMYNTLNTIRMFAMMKDYEKINSLMGRLVALLRYSMENFEQTVQLQQELDYLADYVGLLNMRYKCQIHLEAEIEEPLRGMQIPKLSLQPLIENSVFHGILPRKATEGHITVRVFSSPGGSHIILEVKDDGTGLEEAELKKLQLHLQQEESTENIGLQNVWMRMKLLFGSGTQILLSSTPGEGLIIRMLLPSETVLIREEHHESL
ncbi:histidine kinase [Paenibacillus tritici]|uniref:Histidine kinase n=1 Tax=Paenibacillus tritici TaxID=1873425 RepID=A0ABX2DTC7_9BACL|nr:histidine kinase [Paenibacillus tritici]NQX47417.1 histidine kinase [Paenibacillus tritici]QUL55915.1 histidine kinase [Paenibacillus tritici]